MIPRHQLIALLPDPTIARRRASWRYALKRRLRQRARLIHCTPCLVGYTGLITTGMGSQSGGRIVLFCVVRIIRRPAANHLTRNAPASTADRAEPPWHPAPGNLVSILLAGSMRAPPPGSYRPHGVPVASSARSVRQNRIRPCWSQSHRPHLTTERAWTTDMSLPHQPASLPVKRGSHASETSGSDHWLPTRFYLPYWHST